VSKTRAEGRVIARAWRRVPLSVHLEVLRLAKRGQRYPDPAVNVVAGEYCRAVLGRTTRSVPAVALLMGFLFVTLAVWAGDSFGLLVFGLPGLLAFVLAIFTWDLRRDAKKILAVQGDDV
jgi:hypothetical protein